MTHAMNIRCGDCGATWVAHSQAEACAPCGRCAQAAAAGRPFYPGSATPRVLRDALKEVQAQLAAGDVRPLGPEDEGFW